MLARHLSPHWRVMDIAVHERYNASIYERRIIPMSYNVAVVGATGNVGREMLNILSEREFPAKEVFAHRLAPVAGAGGVLRRQAAQMPRSRNLRFPHIDIALMSAGGDVSKEWSPRIAAQGLPGHR